MNINKVLLVVTALLWTAAMQAQDKIVYPEITATVRPKKRKQPDNRENGFSWICLEPTWKRRVLNLIIAALIFRASPDSPWARR